MRSKVAASLLKIDGIDNRKILASDIQVSGLPLSGSALRDTQERHERLAHKYGLTLPPRYRPYPTDDRRYFISSMPWAVGGLEKYNEEDLKTIKPFGWPVQREEWILEYWLGKGYTVFLVVNEQEFLKSDVAAYRQLHQEIADRCRLLDEITGEKTLFIEGDAKVYLCNPRQKRPTADRKPLPRRIVSDEDFALGLSLRLGGDLEFSIAAKAVTTQIC
jgi:hypothetical protein